MISASFGKISELVVVSSGAISPHNPEAAFSRLHSDLCHDMHPGTKIWWVYAGEQEHPLPQFCLDGVEICPVKLPEIDSLAGHSRWIQDPFISVQTQAGLELLLPVNAHAIDWTIVQQLAFVTGRVIRPVALPLEGGNILALDGRVLVGKDLQVATPASVPDPEAELKFLTGAKEVVPIGLKDPFKTKCLKFLQHEESWQPFFHLDLFLLPGGKQHDGKYLVFLGEVSREWTVGLKNQHASDFSRLQEALEEIKAQLEELRDPQIEVCRLPLPLSIGQNRVMTYSFCNGLAEQAGGKRRIWLPEFSISKRRRRLASILSSAAVEVRSRLGKHGIQTRFVHSDFTNTASEGGALHCSVKVLGRDTN